jgi:hypothetical protein
MAMTGSTLSAIMQHCGARITDSLYQVSVVSTLGFSGGLLMLGLVGAAVAMGAVDVPEFHPK